MMLYSKAVELASSFRLLADFIEDHFDQLPEEIDVEISSWCSKYGDPPAPPKEVIARAIAAGLKGGATISKKYSDWDFRAELMFGALKYEVKSARDAVCTKIVVGTETVEEEEREGEDERPVVMVTREKEITEWKCDPILEALTEGKE